MMKRFSIALVITLIISCLSSCHKVEYGGLTGKILHKKYNPALNINRIRDNEPEQVSDTLKIDLDEDGSHDLKLYFFYEQVCIEAANDWELSVTTDGYMNTLNWWNRDYRVLWGHLVPLCVRHSVDEGYCYGWLDCYSTLGSEGQVDVIRFYFRETGYCTCPNYPLKWGEK